MFFFALVGRCHNGEFGPPKMVALLLVFSQPENRAAPAPWFHRFVSLPGGVYILRFYKHGQWHHVVIDDALPFDSAMNPLCSRSMSGLLEAGSLPQFLDFPRSLEVRTYMVAVVTSWAGPD